ncbi:MAG: hypothetical protein U1E05_02495, partial [Patescibacteria group bacterium]|nr:hypothetical protein [Patescibacteria group bacterium]
SGSIRLLDKMGKEVVRVQAEHGLPECDRTLKVYPLGQAQAIAAGSFGRHDRMWIGMVDAAGSTPKVTVFHQATRLKDATKTTSNEEADLVARPSWIQEYPYPKDHPRLILIGRGGHSHALAVDMQTRDVTVYDPGPTNVESTSFCRYGNCLLYAVQQVPMMIGDTIPDYLGAPSGHSMHPTHILNWNGYLYVTGSPWHRIDPAIWRAEPLIPEQAPVSGHARWGVSVLHGIVCWGNRNDFFRVIIKDSHLKVVPKQPSTDGQQASPPAFEPRFFREPR